MTNTQYNDRIESLYFSTSSVILGWACFTSRVNVLRTNSLPSCIMPSDNIKVTILLYFGIVLVSCTQVFHWTSAYRTENEFKQLHTILHSIVYMLTPSGRARGGTVYIWIVSQKKFCLKNRNNLLPYIIQNIMFGILAAILVTITTKRTNHKLHMRSHHLAHPLLPVIIVSLSSNRNKFFKNVIFGMSAAILVTMAM